VIVDLSRVEQVPFAFREELVLGEDRLGTDVVAPLKVLLEGEVRRVAPGFVVEGRFQTTAEVPCARCLEPVPWSADECFSLQFLPAADAPEDEEVGLGEEDLGVSFLQGDSVDLVDIAAEQVLLALPMRTLCNTSCAGLCPQCGGNRNVDGACRCEPQIDPRWESLRSAFDQSS
jgi:uncharacterized protein